MARAVVLGSGGATGGAWEIGVLKGLGDADVDLTRADFVVGSSVGAVLGCQIQSGQSVGDLYAARARPPSSIPAPSPVGQQEHHSSAADLEYFRECLRMWSRAREDLAVRIELGRRALATPTRPEALHIESRGAAWPCTAGRAGWSRLPRRRIGWEGEVLRGLAGSPDRSSPWRQAVLNLDCRHRCAWGTDATWMEAPPGPTSTAPPVTRSSLPASRRFRPPAGPDKKEIDEVSVAGGQG